MVWQGRKIYRLKRDVAVLYKNANLNLVFVSLWYLEFVGLVSRSILSSLDYVSFGAVLTPALPETQVDIDEGASGSLSFTSGYKTDGIQRKSVPGEPFGWRSMPIFDKRKQTLFLAAFKSSMMKYKNNTSGLQMLHWLKTEIAKSSETWLQLWQGAIFCHACFFFWPVDF